MIPKNTICLWYDGDALEAANFYAATFPDSRVDAVHHAPGDYPDGQQGDVLAVDFTVMGIPCMGLNGGPAFKHSEAFSFQVATDDQEETDRYWNAIVGNAVVRVDVAGRGAVPVELPARWTLCQAGPVDVEALAVGMRVQAVGAPTAEGGLVVCQDPSHRLVPAG